MKVPREGASQQSKRKHRIRMVVKKLIYLYKIEKTSYNEST